MESLSAKSTVDNIVSKPFSNGRYIETIEMKLRSSQLSNAESAVLYTNMAAAQYELGLFRKCLKSSQCAIDLSPSHTRAFILKGKALIASGKESDAIELWSNFFKGDTLLCDVLLIQEMSDLLDQISNSSTSHQQSAGPEPESPTTINPNYDSPEVLPCPPPPTASTMQSDTLSEPVEPKPPTSPVVPPLVKLATKGPASTPTPTVKANKVDRLKNMDSAKALADGLLSSLPAGLSKQIALSVSSAVNSANSKAGLANSNTATSAPKVPNKQSTVTSTVSKTTPPKAAITNKLATKTPASSHQVATVRKALMDFHSKNIGTSSSSQVKPLFLKAMKSNLPHLCGEDLVDDLVGFGYINVNSGNHQLAVTVFKLLLQYRQDLPSALIGLGSIHAMQRQLDLAIEELSAAIEIDDTIADAWKRRGQTKAAKQMISSSLKDLTKALSLQSDADIYNQRGLVYNQAKNYMRALSDFRNAQAKGLHSAALLNYIGMCEGQLGNVSLSIESHKAAVAVDPKLREAFLNMALMYKETGQWEEALTQFDAAINADPSRYFSQAHNYRSVMWYQVGRPAVALRDTAAALQLLSQNIGQQSEAMTVAQTEDLLQNLIRAAICCQALGQYQRCIEYFDRALTVDSTNNCWFQREIALFFWHQLDTDLQRYSSDEKVDSRLKDGWCKHVPFRDYMAKAQVQQFQGVGVTASYHPLKVPKNIPSLAIAVEDDGVGVDHSANESFRQIRDYELKIRLLELAKPFSSWIQLQTPGFLPNRRQHRMFGLAVLQMACSLRRHMTLIQLEGVGLEVSDASSSKQRPTDESGTNSPSRATTPVSQAGSGSKSAFFNPQQTQPSSGKRGLCFRNHTMGWRDLYDVAVRWRQVSEPNDPVWWIDRFPLKAFSEGFGLQTPIVNGQMKTVRYYPYFPKAFGVLKSLMRDGYYSATDRYEQVEQAKMERFEAATSLADISALLQKDFYVVVPCPSLKSPGTVLEGTRLTLVSREPDGFEFTIRTPGKPYRWSQYEAELDCSFQRLEDAFLSHRGSASKHSAFSSRASSEGTSCGDDGEDGSGAALPEFSELSLIDQTKQVVQNQRVLKQALELFYLWVTFAPLSRGTAACGYAALVAILLAHGKRIARPLPAGKQLDWEAIFARDCAEFVDSVVTWFPLVDADLSAEALVTECEAIFGGSVTTLRDMLELLALPYSEE